MEEKGPTVDKRERILHAVFQASREETKKANTEHKKWVSDERHTESSRRCCDMSSCVSVDESVAIYKVVYFLFSAGIPGILPYAIMNTANLGLSLRYVGLVVGCGLLVAFVFTFLWGCLADKLRWHRGMLIVAACLWLGCATVFTFVPRMGSRSIATATTLSCEDIHLQLAAHCSELETSIADRGKPDDHQRVGRGVYQQIGHVAYTMHTWPKQRLLSQVCPSHDNSTTSYPANDQAIPNGRPTSTTVQTETGTAWLYASDSVQRSAAIAFVVSAVGGIGQITTFSLVDVATLVALGEAGMDRYGWQRTFGTIGFTLSSLTVGLVLYEFRETETYCNLAWEKTDYFIGFVVFFGFVAAGVVFAGCLDFRHSDMSSVYRFDEITSAVLSYRYGPTFFTAFMLSFVNGAWNTLLYWHLHQQGASPLLLGAGIALYALGDVVISYCTVWLVRELGYHVCMLVGLSGYFLVCLGYAVMTRPQWLVVIEVIRGASSAITLNTMTSFIASSVTLVGLASVQGFLSGIYWGLGPAAGTLLFSLMGDCLGVVLSLYALSLGCIVCGIVFVICNREELRPLKRYLPGSYTPLKGDSSDAGRG